MNAFFTQFTTKLVLKARSNTSWFGRVNPHACIPNRVGDPPGHVVKNPMEPMEKTVQPSGPLNCRLELRFDLDVGLLEDFNPLCESFQLEGQVLKTNSIFAVVSPSWASRLHLGCSESGRARVHRRKT
jgi:hypothetical protein